VLGDFLYWAFERGVLGKGTSQVAAAIVQARLSHTAPEPGMGGDHARRVAIVKEFDAKVGPAGSAAPAPRLRDVPRKVRREGAARGRHRHGARGGACPVAEGLLRLDRVRASRGGPRFDFDLVAYGFLHGDFSEENLVIWAVDVAVEKNLGARGVEHFENRCRLLALEKGYRTTGSGSG